MENVRVALTLPAALPRQRASELIEEEAHLEMRRWGFSTLTDRTSAGGVLNADDTLYNWLVVYGMG